ncbi:MAG: TolC family outer membrane protein, partial [Caulobacteraceae bacterium]
MAAACLSAPLAHAETLADAVALAYQSNPTLQAQRAQLRATDETYVQARAGWRPTASAQVGANYSKAPESTLFGVSQVESNTGQAILGVTQPIYTGGRTAAEVRATESDVMAARQGLRATEAQVLQGVVQAYADVLRDQQLLAVHQDDVAMLQREVDDANARLQAGEVTRTDVAQTETQLISSQSALTAAKGQLQVSRSNYAQVVGQNPGQLAPPPALPGLPIDVDHAFDAAEADNPTLRQAEFTEQSSRIRVAEARAANRPTLSVNANIGLTGPVTPFFGNAYDRAVNASAVITQPILTGGVNASQIRRALELNNSDRISIETTRRAVVQAVSQAWNGMVTGRNTTTGEEKHVGVAQDYFFGTREEYKVGQRATLDIIVAEQSFISARLALISARHDTYVAESSLLAAVGRLEARYLTPDTPSYDPAKSFKRVKNAGDLPWEGVVAAID